MYTQLAEIPVPTSALFIPSQDPADIAQTVVQVTFSVRDHGQNVKRTMSKNIIFPSASDSARPLENDAVVSTPLLDTDIVAQIVSPTGRSRATLRNVKTAKGRDGAATRVVEVWREGLLVVSMDVTEYHGDFYTDEFLDSFCFAPSELAILYTAEGTAPESKDSDPYSKFRFIPDLGEGLSGKKRPTTFILRWDDSDTSSAANTPPKAETKAKVRASLVQLNPIDGVRFGQAVFSPNSDEIIYATGYELTPEGRQLGIKWCYNRPAGIWRLRIATPAQDPERSAEIAKPPTAVDILYAQKLTAPNMSCRSPRVLSSDGKSSLLWLASRSGGAHAASTTLHKLDITSDAVGHLKFLSSSVEPTTLVGVIETPDPSLKTFPGLYPAYNLPTDFAIKSSDSPTSSIVVASQWGSRTTVLAISAESGSVTNLTPESDDKLYSWLVLATDGRDRVLCSRSSHWVPYEIVIGTLDGSSVISWTLIDRPALPKAVAKALSAIKASIIPIPGRPFVETIVIQGKKEELSSGKPPCITSPHGGPHSTTSTAFSPNTTALVLEGYTLSLPNYTGSPGYGEKFIQDLIGRCGELDVQDCIASARHLIELGISEPGPGKQFIAGGSHGGFLTAHLIGQFPDFFSAAVLRNPVISVGDILNTDIPDWYFAEFGLEYAISSSPIARYEGGAKKVQLSLSQKVAPLITVDAFEKLQAASPTAYLDDMKVPVLLLIGAADRRVAPAQGFLLYHALKARYAQEGKNDKVEMLVFEGESHPLDGVEASRVGFEATRDWFKKALAGPIGV
ncbi:alpha/beta-hydrolase [Pholiota conissans]|uniref:acylaminoacyl-peptidase n=1 Tax=Pholiota conissans TaxID=109636 RepID=A0A9P5YTV4_9AGAR|nr:alpha/beta-hydrolase [Pholiota conissans]